LNTSNGANVRRGETSSHPPFASASSAVRAVYMVRTVQCFVTPVISSETDHRQLSCPPSTFTATFIVCAIELISSIYRTAQDVLWIVTF